MSKRFKRDSTEENLNKGTMPPGSSQAEEKLGEPNQKSGEMRMPIRNAHAGLKPKTPEIFTHIYNKKMGEMRTPGRNMHAGLKPKNARNTHSQLPQGQLEMRMRGRGALRRSLKRRLTKASTGSRFQRRVGKNRKKRALIGLALGALAVGSISNTIQIQQVSSEVSIIGKEMAKLELRVTNNKKHVLELMTAVGDEVSRNSRHTVLQVKQRGLRRLGRLNRLKCLS